LAEYDVVVVGSGAAALTAALTALRGGLSVVVIERAAQLGGTTAYSGGMLWVPGNSHFREVGGAGDSLADAGKYIRSLTQGLQYDDALIDVFLQSAPEAVDFLEHESAVRFTASRFYTDYYADRPGSARGGRSILPETYDPASGLGDWASQVCDSPQFPDPISLDELTALGLGRVAELAQPGPVSSQQLLESVEQRKRRGSLTGGRALVGALLAELVRDGATVSTGTRAISLIVTDGRVTGCRVVAAGRASVVSAQRGVILASGGFEWNRRLLSTFLGSEVAKAVTPRSNEGDGLIMGLAAGAGLANMNVGWNYLVVNDHTPVADGASPLPVYASIRLQPGCVIVNRDGQRFVNEGAAYMDVARAMYQFDEVRQSYPNLTAFLVFDSAVRGRATMGTLRPDEPTPAWVCEAPTLAELARDIGVDPDGIEREIATFNRHAAAGTDTAHGRGTLWFEGQLWDGPTPARSLAAITTPPFYAVRVLPGLLGTAGGLRIDGNARVLSFTDSPIPGLWACGNVAASIFGPVYPGGGTTLALAVAFGYRAGLDARKTDPVNAASHGA
jgi:succinate dehydrogenase/fumarate reductase flavoprotein subunit